MKKKVVKIALLGDGGCGKTSLIRAKSKHMFLEDSEMTIGVDIACIPFEMSNNDEVAQMFLAMDLGGQDRFQFIHDAYIKGIQVAVILYDMSRYFSFRNLPHWFNLVENERESIPIFLIGSKLDLVERDRITFYQEEWEILKNSIPNADQVISHLFISAKTNEGVEELFQLCEKILLEIITPSVQVVKEFVL